MLRGNSTSEASTTLPQTGATCERACLTAKTWTDNTKNEREARTMNGTGKHDEGARRRTQTADRR